MQCKVEENASSQDLLVSCCKLQRIEIKATVTVNQNKLIIGGGSIKQTKKRFFEGNETSGVLSNVLKIHRSTKWCIGLSTHNSHGLFSLDNHVGGFSFHPCIIIIIHIPCIIMGKFVSYKSFITIKF